MTPRSRAMAGSLVILAGVAAAGAWQYTAGRPTPAVDSRRIDTGAEAPAVGLIGPTARQALERRAELGLTERQAARLQALDREWQRKVGPLELEVRQSEAKVQRFMHEARGTGGASLVEIQRRAAGQAELFAAYRERQAAHVAAVRRVLTEDQRGRWTAMVASPRAGERR